MINDLNKANKDNIFNLISDFEGLILKEKESFVTSNTNKSSSSNEEIYSRSPSCDYFRGSSLGTSIPLADNFDFSEINKNKLLSKKSFEGSDFKTLATIGSGAYSKVIKAKYVKTHNIYAIKIIDKHFMEKEKKYYQIHVENELLNMCDSPNIVEIYGAYEDDFYIYLVLEYCEKGDLENLMEKYGSLEKDLVKFLSAQLVLMIEYLDSLNIVHRDLKPENILINNYFVLKLADFATASIKGKIYDENKFQFVDPSEYLQDIEMRSPEKKVCSSDSDSQTDSDSEEKSSSEIKLGVKIDTRPKKESKMEKPFKNLKIDDFEAKLKRQAYKRQNFVGTAEYMAPEVIQMKEVGVYTDLWSLGCIIYQMFMGKSPFEDKTEYLIFQRILNLDYEIDEKKVPQDAADLIRCLLKLDPSERLGCGSENSGNSINQLKSHKFFDDFDKKKYMDFLDLLEDDKQPFKQKIFATEISEKSTKEVVLKSGELKKRSPWFYYDKRLVVLYSTPRIDYIDPITSIVKGTINLTHECEAVLIDSCSFELKTPSRNFKFMCKNKYDISPWVEKINEAIKTYSKL